MVNTMMTNPGNMFQQDAVQWQWKDDRGQWNSYSSFDSRIIEVNSRFVYFVFAMHSVVQLLVYLCLNLNIYKL